MSTNFHTVIPQRSSQYHHLSSLKSYIHFHNFFTLSTHHPHSPLTDFSHAFIHHSHTTGHIETPFRPSKQTSNRLCSRPIHIPTTTFAHQTSLVDDETDADTKGSWDITETVYLESVPELYIPPLLLDRYLEAFLYPGDCICPGISSPESVSWVPCGIW